ncbi:protein-L-isoaspartate(D-aspartate) O-methyltransferase [bacterium]|nr:protein-L-isoaspartate(D-aspartate) O-methyltransferase [bacterium]
MDYEVARIRMVKEQLISRGISDERVLGVMNSLPRHFFVDQAFWPRAYGDHPLPIGCNQTISQPYIVGLMTQALGLSGGERILEIGTGSGYQAALLAVLGCTVYTIEYHEELLKHAMAVIKKLGIQNIMFFTGDGSVGLQEQAPFDRILVTAGAPDVPDFLLDQVALKGRLVIPIGNRNTQRLIVIIKGENMIEKHDICDCAFVPLIGKQGWTNG